jgi:hypothetical protein
LNQGVMTGESMLNYIPLHLSAVERSPLVVDWVRSWWEERLGQLLHLGVDEWFTKGQEEGNFLWTPPPAAANVVAEQVGEARHKHPLTCHIVVVPRLMTGSWRRLMTRQTDFNTTIPTGVSFWPLGEFEPLTMFVYLPLIPCSPWSIRGTDLLASLGGELRSVRGQCEGRKRELLRELLFRTWKFSSLPEGVVWEMLHRPSWESLSHQNGNR